MGIRKVQVGFSAGELSPSMYGRFDDPKYAQGLARCRNFIVRPQGPAEFRPGTQFVRAAKYSDKPCKLIPFVFNTDQTMVLEFGEGYIRFHTEGKTLLNSNGAPYEVQTPYLAKDLFGLHYAQKMDVMTLVHGNYPPKELRRYGANDWRLTNVSFSPAINAPTINSVVYHVVAGDGVTIKEEEKTRFTLRYRVTAILDTGDCTQESPASNIGSCQGNLYLNNSSVTITWTAVPGASRYRVYKNKGGLYSYIGETEDTSLVDDNLDADSGITPPRYDSTFQATGAITAINVTNGGTGYKAGGEIQKCSLDELEAMASSDPANAKYGTEAFSAFLLISVVTATESFTVLDAEGAGTGGVVSWNGDQQALVPTSVGSGYVKPYIYSHYKSSLGGKELEIKIPLKASSLATLEISGTGTGAVATPVISGGQVVSVKLANGGLGYTGSTYVTIRNGSGSGASFSVSVNSGKSQVDNPSAVAYYEQRRVFAGSTLNPQTVWMTRSGTESDLSYTIPAQADNRIRFTIAAQEASKIIHLVPLSQLVALTNSMEYRVSSGTSAALAPDAIEAKVQANIGSAMAQPVIVNATLVYAAARGNHVRELGYNWQASGFSTGDISIRSDHFFENNAVKDMALSRAPDSIVWCSMADGSLLGCTYLPEQGVCGWHRHEFTNGAVESVTALVEGPEDIVYLSVRRTINGSTVRYIERMHERFCSRLEDAFHVDCGAIYTGTAAKEISGLSWLEGERVSIFANGCVLPSQVVTNGKVKLSQPSTKVFIGLPVIGDFQTLPCAVQMSDNSFGIGHSKNINEVYLRVVKASGVWVGPDFDHLVEVKQRTTEPYGSPPNWMEKEISVMPYCQWNDSGQVCVRQADPLPLTIVSIAFDLAQ